MTEHSLARAPLLMEPHFSPRPWGGTLLRDRLGKSVPSAGGPFGEAWELSDHPNGRSRVAEGPHRETEFGDLVRAFPRETVGRAEAPARYPLLVKFIDAAEDLSIQVHPNDDQARAAGDRGKTECWYVMDCEPGTEIIFGLARDATPEALRMGAKDGSLGRFVARHRLRRGDFLFVRAGTVHAILGGTLICEIQQSSDTTYRLWDWNREPPRPLHVEESIAVIDWSALGESPRAVGEPGSLEAPTVLTDNEFFRVQALDVPPGASVALPAGLQPTGQIIVCVEGSVRLSAPDGAVDLEAGRTAFLPACCEGRATLESRGTQPARLLVAESREM